ncbi:hypothetical protein MNBD_GAMMA03-811, partial [hydrothermal vent metagenome]
GGVITPHPAILDGFLPLNDARQALADKGDGG